jgi:hypothetical protein
MATPILVHQAQATLAKPQRTILREAALGRARTTNTASRQVTTNSPDLKTTDQATTNMAAVLLRHRVAPVGCLITTRTPRSHSRTTRTHHHRRVDRLKATHRRVAMVRAVATQASSPRTADSQYQVNILRRQGKEAMVSLTRVVRVDMHHMVDSPLTAVVHLGGTEDTEQRQNIPRADFHLSLYWSHLSRYTGCLKSWEARILGGILVDAQAHLLRSAFA